MTALVSSPSCSDPDRPEADCFSQDPWADERAAAAAYAESEDFRPDEYDRMIREIGFCEYGPEEVGQIFPEHEGITVDRPSYCQEAESCEQCVSEEIDEGIRGVYSELQDIVGCPTDTREILAYERGCVTFVGDGDGGPRCCYSAAIVSECPLNSVPTG